MDISMAETMTLYHATHSDFLEFDLSMAGTNSDNAGNSGLGIWFAVDYSWIAAFGRRVIKAEIDLGNCYVMSIHELRELSFLFQEKSSEDNNLCSEEDGRDLENARWVEHRKNLLERGYATVAIEESGNKGVHMYVILKVENILTHCNFNIHKNSDKSNSLSTRPC
jgi:hypothetical protein